MRGRMVSFSVIPRSRKQLLTVEVDGDIGELVDALRDVDIDFQMKKWREKRSRNANDYLWMLCTKLGEKMKLPAEEIYRNHIKYANVCDFVAVPEKAAEKLIEAWKKNGIGWFAEVVDKCKLDGCKKVCLWYGSSTYDTEQMSRLIDAVVEDCRSLGIETMTPAELASLKEGWR